MEQSHSQILTRAQLLAFAALVLVILFRAPLQNSFWVDEAITWWVSRDSLEFVFSRTFAFQGQSPLYYAIIWCVRQWIGSTELILRLPSILGIAISALLLFGLVRRRSSGETAWFAVVLFLSLNEILVAALSARPYGLALAAALGSTWLFLSWSESGKFRFALGHLVVSLLCFYLHYFFAGILLIQLGFYAATFRSSKITLPKLVLHLVLLGCLFLPGLQHLIELSQRGAEIGFVSQPTIISTARIIFPPVLVILSVLGVILGVLFGGGGLKRPSLTGFGPVFFWWLFPPILFCVYSLYSATSLFLPRWFLWYAPGLVFSFALLAMQSLATIRARQVALLALTLFALLRESGRVWAVEDWRGAAQSVVGNTPTGEIIPVLLYSGLAESDVAGWEGDATKSEYLAVPFVVYSVSAPVLSLTSEPSKAGAQAYFESLLGRKVANADKFFLVLAKKKNGDRALDKVWQQAMEGQGYESRQLMGASASERVTVFLMTRQMAEHATTGRVENAPHP